MAGTVLIYGGRGALGSECVGHFKRQGWKVYSVDMHRNDEADTSICLDVSSSWEQQSRHVLSELSDLLQGSKLDAIICVAGGFAMGNISQHDVIRSCDLMWKQSVWTSIISGQVASAHLRSGGLLQLTGAYPGFGSTPATIGYGMAKAAVHQLVGSLAGQGIYTVGLSPITLDTAGNRKAMPDADFKSWTTLMEVAELLENLASGADKRDSGSLLVVKTDAGTTTVTKR